MFNYKKQKSIMTEYELKKFLFSYFKNEEYTIPSYIEDFIIKIKKVEEDLAKLDKKNWYRIFDAEKHERLLKNRNQEFLRGDNLKEQIIKDSGGNRFFIYVNALKSNPDACKFSQLTIALKQLYYKLYEEKLDLENVKKCLNRDKKVGPFFINKFFHDHGKYSSSICYNLYKEIKTNFLIDEDERYFTENPQSPVFVINNLKIAKEKRIKELENYSEKKFNEFFNYLDYYKDIFSSVNNEDFYRFDNKLTDTIYIDQLKENIEKLFIKKGYGSFIAKLPKRIEKELFLNKIHKLNGEYNFKSNVIWLGWHGGVNNLDRINLNLLNERDILWIEKDDMNRDDVIKNFIKVIETLSQNGIVIGKLRFAHVPHIDDQLNHSQANISIWTKEELLQEAYNCNIPLPKLLKKELADTYKDYKKIANRQLYIVDNVIRKNSFHLLTARQGQGKSYFSMFLAQAIAQKGKLFADWKVKKSVKILYVLDDEVDRYELEQRRDNIGKMFPKSDKLKEISYLSVSNFNLLEEKFQNKVEDALVEAQLNKEPKTEKVQLLILDHLTKLAPTTTNERNWQKLRPWIHKLTKEMNIAVILLHHENKGNTTFGTSQIENDIDIKIKLERKPVDDFVINLTVPKNRQAPVQIENPHQIQFHLNGKPRMAYLNNLSNENIKWRKRSIENKLHYYFALKNSQKTMQEIADYFGIAKPTIEKFAKENELTNDRYKEHDDYHNQALEDLPNEDH
ncbi:AAA family ATPase [Lentisphaerota bacterium WC36G]|nr:AAA family ATPase [Lentisphaerae bacterium WC36]UDQ98329.1 AAA family ATPase [Lentisphaerae bacterium WC36]